MKIIFLLLISLFISIIINSEKKQNQIKITIIYDNYQFNQNTKTDWGFSCIAEGTEKTILFDTGGKSDVLLYNIEKLNINLNKVDLIVISHNHWDHTGGLSTVLDKNHNVKVYFGQSYPNDFEEMIAQKKATPIRVNQPFQICENVYTTGELTGPANEQSLIIDTAKGLIIITGCSHPGIVEILKTAKAQLNKEIYMVFGGFHLLRHSESEINEIIKEFKTIGVKYCGATHCTGDQAISMFKQAFGENYVQMGTGKVITIE